MMRSEASSIYSRPTGLPDPQVPNFLTLSVPRNATPQQILDALGHDSFYENWVWPFKRDFSWMQAPLPTSHVSAKMEKFKKKVARARTWAVRCRVACDDSYDQHRQRIKIWGKHSDRISSAKREFPKLKQLREYLILMVDRLDDIETWACYWEHAETVPAELRIAVRWAYQWVEKLDICLEAFDIFYARLDVKEQEARLHDQKRISKERKTNRGREQTGRKNEPRKRKQTSSWGSVVSSVMGCSVRVE